MKLLPKGISVCVLNGTNHPIEATEDGCLGNDLKAKLLLQISATPEPHHRIWAVIVDGHKNVSMKKNEVENGNGNGNGNRKLYRLTVPVKQNEQGVSHTEYPQNNLRLMHMRTEGNLDIWEIAIVSQNGVFFLTKQLVYQTRCYRWGKMIVCPHFEKSWPSLIQALNQVPGLRQLLKELPSLPKHLAEPRESRPCINQDNQGIVLWYNDAQQVGAILTKYGQARVHWTQTTRPGLRRYLKPNEMVRFQGLRCPETTKGRPTGFKREAIGVEPLPSLPASP